MTPPTGEPETRLARAVLRAARSVPTLADATERLVVGAPEADVRAAAGRGWFRPGEEERLVAWFLRFSTVRESLWDVLGELVTGQGGDLGGLDDDDAWRAFVLGYGAACAVVRLDRFLVEHLAVDRVTQRKLNEGVAEHQLPRKRYTAVFDSLTDPASALLLDEAMQVRRDRADRLATSAADPLLRDVVARLPSLESSLDRSRRRFFWLFARFQSHALRRRLAAARDRGLFAALEGSCRVVSELRDRWRPRRVTSDVRERIAGLLAPGDVLVTRTDGALSNAFLPGYWPHAALHVGTESDRARLGVKVDAERAARWSDPARVLEALKDGVRFRPLAETLDVDAVAVLRPGLSERAIAESLTRVVRHEGKAYDFDFDFFRSDCLVCSEVVYRAYDGVEGLDLPLSARVGRPTLAAQDLLELALDGRGLSVVAAHGVPAAPDAFLEGAEAVEPLRQSCRS